VRQPCHIQCTEWMKSDETTGSCGVRPIFAKALSRFSMSDLSTTPHPRRLKDIGRASCYTSLLSNATVRFPRALAFEFSFTQWRDQSPTSCIVAWSVIKLRRRQRRIENRGSEAMS
jgi:hypothetical protein